MGINQSKVLTTMGAGLTTGLFWYLMYGSQEAKLRRRAQMKPVMGLKNAGSTCFLNSVLQALASSNHFANWMAHKDDANSSDFPARAPANYAAFQYPIIAVVYRSLLIINREIGDYDDDRFMEKVPDDIIGTLRQEGYKFRTTEEQDTYEFFQFLVGALCREVECSIRRQQIGTLDSLVDEEDSSEVSGELISCSEMETSALGLDPLIPVSTTPPNLPPLFLDEYVNSQGWSIVHDPAKSINRVFSKRKVTIDTSARASSQAPFRGIIWTSLQCISCWKKTPPRLESFDSVTLMLPAEKLGGPYGLSSLIVNFFKPTFVTDVDCQGCSRQFGHPVKSTFTKNTFMGRMPKTLCLHILRTSWSGSVSKRTEHVQFSELLNLAGLERHFDEYRKMDRDTAEDDSAAGNNVAQDPEVRLKRFKESQYRLVAVVSHLGDPEFGHFVTYRRGPSKNRLCGLDEWFCVSDELVQSASLAEVLSTRAYMLFYEKPNVQKSASSMAN